MKPRDLFKLAVQILGLVFLYRGLAAVPSLFAGIFGSVHSAIVSILFVAWPLLVAYWLLRGAPLLMHIAYPDSKD